MNVNTWFASCVCSYLWCIFCLGPQGKGAGDGYVPHQGVEGCGTTKPNTGGWPLAAIKYCFSPWGLLPQARRIVGVAAPQPRRGVFGGRQTPDPGGMGGGSIPRASDGLTRRTCDRASLAVACWPIADPCASLLMVRALCGEALAVRALAKRPLRRGLCGESPCEEALAKRIRS